MNILKDSGAEKLANEIAANWDERNNLYLKFIIRNPDLKLWEGIAIQERARFLYKNNKLIKV